LILQELLIEGFAALTMYFPALISDPSIERLNRNKNFQSSLLLPQEAYAMAAELLHDDFALHSLAQVCHANMVATMDAVTLQRKMHYVGLKSAFLSLFLAKLQAAVQRFDLAFCLL
jgi:hypothetical protein